MARKQFSTTFFFFSPQLVLQFTVEFNGFITEKTILFQGSRGVQLFSWVVKML